MEDARFTGLRVNQLRIIKILEEEGGPCSTLDQVKPAGRDRPLYKKLCKEVALHLQRKSFRLIEERLEKG